MAENKVQTGKNVAYIVNASNIIVSVSKDEAANLVKMPNFRMASRAEITKFKAAKGRQTFANPIAKPVDPTIVPEEDGTVKTETKKPTSKTGNQG